MKDKKSFVLMVLVVLAIVGCAIAGYFVYKDNSRSFKNFQLERFAEGKPIIYLYSHSVQNVNVQLGYPEKITVSYPAYQSDGWTVDMEPGGTLYDVTGRSLYALYWESDTDARHIRDVGFVIHRDETVPFLEETLAQLGLSEREAEEFIIYWLPQLQEHEYNYFYFESADEIDQHMPLKMNPSPDYVIRVRMDWTPLDEMIDIPTQKLDFVDRVLIEQSEFYAVEWGAVRF